MSDIVFLKSRRLFLRPHKEEEALLCAIGINDPETRLYLGPTRSFPIGIEEEREWIRNSTKNKNQLVLAIVLLEGDGSPIGSVGLHGIDWINQIATSGSVIYRSEHRNRGYGTEAKMLLLHHAFMELNLRRIESHVLAFNGRSVAALLKQGYREEGRLKARILCKNHFVDDRLFAVFKPDFLKLWHKKKREIIG